MKILTLKLAIAFGPIVVPSLVLLVSYLFDYKPSEIAILAVYLASLHGYICSFFIFKFFIKPRTKKISRDR
jgi:membrane protein DedA with SNARE-associated domain